MQYQKHKQDCLQTCLAHIFNEPYENIPAWDKMINYEGVEEGDLFKQEYEKWLISKGYFRMLIGVNFKDDGTFMTPYFQIIPDFALGILEKPNAKVAHSVILNMNKKGIIESYEDPLKNTEYVWKDLIQIEYLIKLNQGVK